MKTLLTFIVFFMISQNCFAENQITFIGKILPGTCQIQSELSISNNIQCANNVIVKYRVDEYQYQSRINVDVTKTAVIYTVNYY